MTIVGEEHSAEKEKVKAHIKELTSRVQDLCPQNGATGQTDSTETPM